MFFKNAIIYSIKSPKDIFLNDDKGLGAEFDRLGFTPVANQEVCSAGWTSPVSSPDGELRIDANGVQIMRMTREERLLPASVIRDHLDARVAHIEQTQGRKVYRKERETLKEEVVFDLTPMAFTRKSHTYAYLDFDRELLVVDATSYRSSEMLMKLLRDTASTLPCLPIATKASPSAVMTSWLAGEEMPEKLELGNWAKLTTDREDGPSASLDRQDLTANDVSTLIEYGKSASALRLTFGDKVTFKLHSDLRISNMVFSDDVITKHRESCDVSDGDDPRAALLADLTLMSVTIRDLYDCLVEAFGGNREEAI